MIFTIVAVDRIYRHYLDTLFQIISNRCFCRLLLVIFHKKNVVSGR